MTRAAIAITWIDSEMLSNARVVLIRPHFAGNIGSVARVMRNFGLTQLTLVEPVADHLSQEARQLSTHGEHLLDAAIVVPTLDDAVADCVCVVGTSASVEGGYRSRAFGRPDEVLQEIIVALPAGPCALVFGPEPNGLSKAEVARCHGLIRIPTAADYSALNLAQAVAICLYELRLQSLKEHGAATAPSQPVAPFAEQERMFASLREALEAVHFVWGTKGDSLMHAVRQLIVRARPSPNEVRILHGLARQLRWVAAHGTDKQPEDEEPIHG